MNPKICRQYDDRWGNLPYPGSGAYLSDSGCGCLAVYHCAIELDKYKNLTVPKCRDYMVKYATVSDGTLWSGITEGLKHYGFSVHWNESDSMDDIFRELKDSCKCGVILFAKKKAASYGPDGTLWTTIGHYIAFSDYKIENGQHWFYMKDSGPRKHDKWFSYEKSMRGCCRNVWICKSTNGQKRYDPSPSPSPAPTPTPTPTPKPKTYPGNYPVVKKYLEPGDRGENVIRLQQYLDWYFDGAFSKECGKPDGIYGANTLRWVKKMQTKFFGKKEADGLVGPKTIAKMKKEGGYVEPTPAPKNYTEVIDVSAAQSAIDWKKVKAAGISGVMVKCGYRGYEKGILKEDSMFIKHIKGASAAGLKLGIYIYTQAINYKEGKEEADYAISLLNKAGVSLYYPIAIDSEYCPPELPGDKPRANNISKTARTQAIKGFCDQIKARGYRPMLYANLSDLTDKIDVSKLDCDIWCAQYYTKCQYKGKYVMWQYTSTGRVNGVKGNIDRDQCYISTAAPKPNPEPAKDGGKSKAAYSGGYPTAAEINEAANAGIRNNTVLWAKDIAKQGFKYLLPKAPGCYFCGTTKKKAYTCMPYVTAAYAHGGEDPDVLKICKNKHAFGLHEDDSDWQSVIKKGKFKFLGRCKNLNYEDLIPGDVLVQYAADDNSGHMMLVAGGNKLCEALSEGCKVTTGAKSRFNRYKTGSKNFVMRYIGGRTYLKKGDIGTAVTKIQKYLNWYYDGAFFKECGKADGVFGSNTDKWVKKMQKEFFGAKEADGTVGPKTIAEMKKRGGKVESTPSISTPAQRVQTGKQAYSGKFPEVRVKRTSAEVIKNTVKCAKWIAANDDFHYGHGEHAHHNGCYFCNTNQAKKGHMNKWEHTSCCNPFVHTAWAHGGLVPSMLKMCANGKSYGFKKGEGYDASKLFKKVSKDNLKTGDVLCSDGHVALYIGSGKVVHAGHEDDNVPGSSKWNSSISVGTWGGYSRVYRFVGSVDADIIMRKGEVSDRVADLQRYLVWYGALPAGEEADGIYGEKTFKAVVKMQTDFFGAKEADGTIGPKTIAKMKAVKK